MNLKNIILFGLMLSMGVLKAQTDFRPGYIISAVGDTVFGDIDYRSDLVMSSLCKFRDESGEISDYSPDDIMAFRFIDSKYYVSRELSQKKVFLEYLIKGKVNIYYRRDNAGDHYYLDKEDLKLTEIPYEKGIKYVDDKQVYYESKEHIGLLSYYMEDAPDLRARIGSIRQPGHRNLVKLAKDYHNAVCEGEECIIYTKSTPWITILPELVTGVINFSDVEDLNDRFYMHSGIIGHIWMPRSNGNTYIRIGVLISQLDFDGEKKNYFKIPLQLEYIYPKGIIRPRIAYGINFYIPSYHTASIDLGTNVKLSETFFLSITSDIEFNPQKLIVPKSLLSHSFKLGLFFNIR